MREVNACTHGQCVHTHTQTKHTQTATAQCVVRRELAHPDTQIANTKLCFVCNHSTVRIHAMQRQCNVTTRSNNNTLHSAPHHAHIDGLIGDALLDQSRLDVVDLRHNLREIRSARTMCIHAHTHNVHAHTTPRTYLTQHAVDCVVGGHRRAVDKHYRLVYGRHIPTTSRTYTHARTHARTSPASGTLASDTPAMARVCASSSASIALASSPPYDTMPVRDTKKHAYTQHPPPPTNLDSLLRRQHRADANERCLEHARVLQVDVAFLRARAGRGLHQVLT
jgi:hypothetical protein